jgi:hypothetical protein
MSLHLMQDSLTIKVKCHPLFGNGSLIRFAYAEFPPQAYFAVSGMGMLPQIKPKRCSVRQLEVPMWL